MAAVIRALFGIWGYTQRAAPILLAALLAIASYFTALRAGVRLWDDSPAGSLNTPDYFLKEFEWVRMRGQGAEATRTDLSGKMMTHLPADDTIRVEPVTVHRARTGVPTVQLQAGSAKMTSMDGQIELDDDVRVTRASAPGVEPLDIRSPRASVDTDHEVIRLTGGVRMNRGGRTLEAQTVMLDQLAGQLQADQQVRLVLPSSNKLDIQ